MQKFDFVIECCSPGYHIVSKSRVGPRVNWAGLVAPLSKLRILETLGMYLSSEF